MRVIRELKGFWDGLKLKRQIAGEVFSGWTAEEAIADEQTGSGKMHKTSEVEKAKLAGSLTPRERDTYLLLLEGYTLKETASMLGIGYSTANTYQTAVYKKLHVKTRAELIINYHHFGGSQKNDNP